MEEQIRQINRLLWGTPLPALLLGTGVFLTLRLRFFQVTKARLWLKNTLFSLTKREGGERGISQFQALSTALAAALGTGNIAGVAAALAVGGPGAVFWMWVSAGFGMATSFTENLLGIYYRRRSETGEWLGGAMYYLRDGLPKKLGGVLSSVFAVSCSLAAFGIGNMTQANSIAEAMKAEFGVPAVVTGVVLSILTALILVGGIGRIGRVTERLVPLMAILYIAACLLALFADAGRIPSVFTAIVAGAFDLRAAAGGAGGYLISRAVSAGFRRGVFSNEAGLGTAVAVNAASNVREPARQGMWGMFEVFFDTIVMCSLTAFALLSAPASAVGFEEAVTSLSETAQYFSLDPAEDAPLIVGTPNAYLRLADEDAAAGTYVEVAAKSAYGQALTLRLKKPEALTPSDYGYVNLMEIRGVAGKAPDGSPLVDERGDPVLVAVELREVSGAALASFAFAQRFGDLAGKGLALAILFFAFSTIVGWSYCGLQALCYLFGRRAAGFYRAGYVVFVAVGSTVGIGLAWELSDLFNGIMAIPNLIGLILLSGKAVRIADNYLAREKGTAIPPLLSASEERADSTPSPKK
ncbi:MAG: amino acid carrier protein [Bacteroides sp.]|nr:amino acid carrier protein [Roseburia sp.]MCM1462186.1 amino acid carrier protein [Bacteroides sp.]